MLCPRPHLPRIRREEEDTPPQEEDTPPQEEDTPPQEEDTPPQEEDTPPQEEDTTCCVPTNAYLTAAVVK